MKNGVYSHLWERKAMLKMSLALGGFDFQSLSESWDPKFLMFFAHCQRQIYAIPKLGRTVGKLSGTGQTKSGFSPTVK